MLFFPLGIIVNGIAVFVGGAMGAMLGEKIPGRLRVNLTLIFGICSCSMGISTIVKMQTLPALVFAIIIGTAIGELIYLEKGIAWGARKFEKPIAAIFPNKSQVGSEDYMEQLIGIIVLFVASGTGIFGALQSGLTGDHTILITKSILDLFTAVIFAASLGYIVSVVAIPQFIVLMLLFFSAAFIMPMTNASMLADFSACGGVLMFATGLRICGIKVFPIGNMLPAMILVMPFSYFWTTYIIPLLKSMM